ncbi:L-threonylcarbamoyladenylate synthase [Candidatus Poseidonia alphae]|jgi:L-threonylcarbamoyladenylate synthase|uniref:L-threonylcarbamoyladenylate synthase n=1 Tax=Candidatus Poseidonia alphae TaxID=1915863 RepID=UPI00231F09C1|nr:L-threonylcarbamoyladenylate synthase [Candidatus Poseidonia alphae]MDA8529930.1 L-threonylcarbamoyladenylate synthase [Candidatus Poseidonia alphae]MDA8749662.1 L-threonylcarbamoyladenylate synthase [Candidatus Poseidonia alphae]MDA8758630.1 L-threonylcarbamoyladenylate synthase [Candidatus Poseidonia alphae]MDB2335579.1 L-threonylcarbamoyladenylate synthase [Candidatus Poseidonia alphae]
MIDDQTLHHLRNNGVVAYPTSTLPGLACLPTVEGLDALFALKNRASDKPVSLGVLSLEQATTLVHVDTKVIELEAFFPKGGLTFILPARTPLDERLGGSFVAVRCLAHPVARELVSAVGPITATSANESGDEPQLTSQDAGAELRLPPYAILEGDCAGGLGSTIIKVTDGGDAGPVVTVMREGVVPTHEVAEWWKNRN